MKNKQWYRLIVVEVVSLAWPLVGFAQQPQSLTLSEAIELALKSNRQLQAAQQYTDAAKGAASQAGLEDTKEAWDRAAKATPHGQQIVLGKV